MDGRAEQLFANEPLKLIHALTRHRRNGDGGWKPVRDDEVAGRLLLFSGGDINFRQHHLRRSPFLKGLRLVFLSLKHLSAGSFGPNQSPEDAFVWNMLQRQAAGRERSGGALRKVQGGNHSRRSEGVGGDHG